MSWFNIYIARKLRKLTIIIWWLSAFEGLCSPTFQYRGRPRDRARTRASGHQRGQRQVRHTIKAHQQAASIAAPRKVSKSRELYDKVGPNDEKTSQKK